MTAATLAKQTPIAAAAKALASRVQHEPSADSDEALAAATTGFIEAENANVF